MIYKLRISFHYLNIISRPLNYFCTTNTQDPDKDTNLILPTSKLYFWSVNKLFNPKRCYKLFKQNFGCVQSATHICKPKNKPFFIIKFDKMMQNEQFRRSYGGSQNLKSKNYTNQMQQQHRFKQKHFLEIRQMQNQVEVVPKQPNIQDLQKTLNTPIEDIVSPLHKMPYPDQVKQKVNQIKQIIGKYSNAYNNHKLIKQLNKPLKKLSLQKFHQCPKQFNYTRSKCQFTVGLDGRGRPAVGFTKGSFGNNTVMVQFPQNVQIISQEMKTVAKCVEKFIIQNLQDPQYSDFFPFDRVAQKGFWRYLIVRQSKRTQQILVIIVSKTEGFDPKKVQSLKNRIAQKLMKQEPKIKSILFQAYDGKGDFVPTGPYEVLKGEDNYHQIILGYKFRISAGAFVQTHIPMVQNIYRFVIDKAKDYDLVLDLGCGIGIIGTLIMRECKNTKVIGIDINEQSIRDAKQNNPHYDARLGKAENLVKKICEQHRGKNILAILDPPRNGFGKDVMKALRRCQGLNNIIYIACNPKAIQDNLMYLTLPATEKRRCPEFAIHNINGFDLFPLTKHFEVIYQMSRPSWKETVKKRQQSSSPDQKQTST